MNPQRQKFDPKCPFEIKCPIWLLVIYLLLAVGFWAGFFVFLDLKDQGFIVGFLLLSLIFTVGVYAAIYEKLTYSNGVYTYYRPFGKNRTARVEEIAMVKIVTFRVHSKYLRQTASHIFFYDSGQNILIKIMDGKTVRENELFLQSLKRNRIKVLYEYDS
jgi:hypothetical protein